MLLSISLTAWPTWQKSRRNRQLWATLLPQHAATSVSVLITPLLLLAELSLCNLTSTTHKVATKRKKEKIQKMWRWDVGLCRLIDMNSQVCLCVCALEQLGNRAWTDGHFFFEHYPPLSSLSHKGINFSTILAETRIKPLLSGFKWLNWWRWTSRAFTHRPVLLSPLVYLFRKRALSWFRMCWFFFSACCSVVTSQSPGWSVEDNSSSSSVWHAVCLLTGGSDLVDFFFLGGGWRRGRGEKKERTEMPYLSYFQLNF